MTPSPKDWRKTWTDEIGHCIDSRSPQNFAEVKQYITELLQNREAEIVGMLPKEYTFKEVDWGDGVTSVENCEDDTKSRSYCEGYNAALSDLIAALKG